MLSWQMKNRAVNFLRLHKKSVLCHGAIWVLGLVPLLWFKNGFLIDGFDFVFPLNPADNLIRRSFVWDDRLLGGWDGAQFVPHLFPDGVIAALLRGMGLSLISIEKLLFVVLFVLPGLSMYYLASSLARDDRRHMIGLVSAIVYMFNPYTLIQWHDGHEGLLLGYAVMPLLLALYVKGLSDQRGSTKYGLCIGLASLVFASVGSNPAAWIVAFIPIALYFIYHLVLNRRWGVLRYTLRFSILSAVSVALLNFWWILPFANQFIHSSVRFSVAQDAFNVVSAGSFSSLVELFRLFGYWGWYQGYGGEPYFSFSQKYSHGILLVSGIVVSALAFASLLFRPRHRHLLYFALLALLGMFLAKGTHSPLGGVYDWLYQEFPGFWIFRSSWNRFFQLVILGLALLLGTTASEIYHRLKRGVLAASSSMQRRREVVAKAGALCVVLLVLGYSWPLFTGDVIEEKREALGGQHVSIPDYWDEGADWVNQESGEFGLFVLPEQEYVKYVWGYAGTDITPRLVTKPQFLGMPGSEGTETTNALTRSVYGAIHGDSEGVAKALAVMDVKYILQRNDVDWEFYAVDSPEHIESALSSQEGIHLERTFGELDFYENDCWLPSKLYVAGDGVMVDGGIGGVFGVVNSDAFVIGESVFFLSEQLSPNQAELVRDCTAVTGDRTVDISFEKMNPSKYRVTVTNATEPFLLVFSESYHEQWKAFVNSQGGETDWIEAFSQRSIPSDKHLLTNGYANAWYIDPAELGVGEDFSITLYYKPQSLFYLGLVISGLTFVACVGLLVWSWRRGGNPGAKG